MACATAPFPSTVPGLTEYLRVSVVNQVAIDQPRYPGLATALAEAENEAEAEATAERA